MNSESASSTCTAHFYCHDGFYIRDVAGLAYAWQAGHDGKGNGASISGLALSAVLAVGGTPLRGLVLGGGLRLLAGPMGGTSSLAGAFVDWYPAPHGGWHVGAELGPALSTAYIGSTSAWGYGAAAAIHAGYDWWWRIPRWSWGLDLFVSGGTLEAMLDSKGNDTGYRLAPLQVGLGISILFQ